MTMENDKYCFSHVRMSKFIKKKNTVPHKG
jgi:hypothetical protein